MHLWFPRNLSEMPGPSPWGCGLSLGPALRTGPLGLLPQHVPGPPPAAFTARPQRQPRALRRTLLPADHGKWVGVGTGAAGPSLDLEGEKGAESLLLKQGLCPSPLTAGPRAGPGLPNPPHRWASRTQGNRGRAEPRQSVPWAQDSLLKQAPLPPGLGPIREGRRIASWGKCRGARRSRCNQGAHRLPSEGLAPHPTASPQGGGD